MAAALAAAVAAGILDARALWRVATSVPASILAALLALSLVSYGLRALRWHLLVREVAPGVPLPTSLQHYVTGFAFLLTPAKAGEVVRLWLLSARYGVPYARSLPLMLLDRVTDMVCLLTFIAVGLLGRLADGGAAALAVAGLASLGLLASLLLSQRRVVVSVVLFAHRRTGRRWPAVFAFALRFYRTLRALCRPRLLALAVLLGLVGWAALIAATWLLLHTMGFQADLLLCAFVFAASVLMAAVPMFPGGIGGAEAVMIALLIEAGLPAEAAVTATLISRLTTFWFSMLLGLLVATVTLPPPARPPRPPTLDPRGEPA